MNTTEPQHPDTPSQPEGRDTSSPSASAPGPGLLVGGVALLVLIALVVVTAAQAQPRIFTEPELVFPSEPNSRDQLHQHVRALFRLKLRESMTPDGLGALLGDPELDVRRADGLIIEVAERASELPAEAPRVAATDDAPLPEARDRAEDTVAAAALNAATEAADQAPAARPDPAAARAALEARFAAAPQATVDDVEEVPEAEPVVAAAATDDPAGDAEAPTEAAEAPTAPNNVLTFSEAELEATGEQPGAAPVLIAEVDEGSEPAAAPEEDEAPDEDAAASEDATSDDAASEDAAASEQEAAPAEDVAARFAQAPRAVVEEISLLKELDIASADDSDAPGPEDVDALSAKELAEQTGVAPPQPIVGLKAEPLETREPDDINSEDEADEAEEADAVAATDDGAHEDHEGHDDAANTTDEGDGDVDDAPAAGAAALEVAEAARAHYGNMHFPMLKGRVATPFGVQRSTRSKATWRHTGWTIKAPSGHRVRSAGEGTVVHSGLLNGYGLTVILDHGDGLHTIYAHLKELHVLVGQSLTRGQPVGVIGSTGTLFGEQLYFELRFHGYPVNPDGWFRPADQEEG